MIKDKRQLAKEIIDAFDPKNIEDIASALKELFSATLEKMLIAQMDQHLGYTKYDYKNKSGKNSRNGFKEKNIVSKYGESTIQVPRDRESTFQPQVV
ncbi:transposase, partial [Thermotalea metallivorans]|uniref:transposase n=1 Tax=Thermotalea metallivorans TaxID=520762 RepID=UPI0018DBAF3E